MTPFGFVRAGVAVVVATLGFPICFFVASWVIGIDLTVSLSDHYPKLYKRLQREPAQVAFALGAALSGLVVTVPVALLRPVHWSRLLMAMFLWAASWAVVLFVRWSDAAVVQVGIAAVVAGVVTSWILFQFPRRQDSILSAIFSGLAWLVGAGLWTAYFHGAIVKPEPVLNYNWFDVAGGFFFSDSRGVWLVGAAIFGFGGSLLALLFPLIGTRHEGRAGASSQETS